MSFGKQIDFVERGHENSNVVWTIRESFPLLLITKVATSREFEFGDDNKNKFQLKLCKSSTSDDCDNSPEYRDGWCLKLRCIDVNNSSITWNYKISFLKNDKMLHTRIDNFTFSATHREEVIFIVLSDEIGQLIPPNDHLKIFCHLYIKKNTDNFLKDNDMIEESGLIFNNNWIFLNENLSDVKLRTACGKGIPAHRVVLANASPVFKAMFTHDMLEKQTQLVDMNDISYDAVVEMLRYIYTGSVETREFSLTAEVLAAADKYQLKGLKNKCERILGCSLSTENAVVALNIAETYSSNHLKKQAVNFVRRILNETLDCDELSKTILSWTQFVSKQCDK